MTDALCRYGGGAAGIVKAAELLDAETRYEFMPYRSNAHLDLGTRFTSDTLQKAK